jgi:hypothetical protein
MVPIASRGETSRPAMATPSSRENANSPWLTAGAGEKLTVPDVSHETAVSLPF